MSKVFLLPRIRWMGSGGSNVNHATQSFPKRCVRFLWSCQCEVVHVCRQHETCIREINVPWTLRYLLAVGPGHWLPDHLPSEASYDTLEMSLPMLPGFRVSIKCLNQQYHRFGELLPPPGRSKFGR